MPSLQKLVDGERGFLGVDTQTYPGNLEAGYLQEGQNIRIEQTKLSTRKGIKSLFGLNEFGDLGGDIINTSVYVDKNGVESIVLLFQNGIRLYRPTEKILSQLYAFESKAINGTTYIRSANQNSEIIQAVNNIYITRGETVKYLDNVTTSAGSSPHTTITVTCTESHNLSVGNEFSIQNNHPQQSGTFFVQTVVSPTVFTYVLAVGHNGSGTGTVHVGKPVLCWNGENTIKPVRQVTLDGIASDFPMCSIAVFHRNRIICKVSRDEIAVSDYLTDDDGEWLFNRTIQQYTINQGDGQEITAIFPWTEDKLLIFKERSIYLAKIADSAESPSVSIGDSFVQTLSMELGCVGQRSVANIGNMVYFVSQKGVYALEPQEDARLLANTTPLSRPFQRYFNRLNKSRMKRIVAKVFNGRLYLGVSLLNEDGTVVDRNQNILIYNILNKAWESIDTFPTPFDVNNMHVIAYGNQYELIYADFDGSVFLADQNEFDEYGVVNESGIRLVINAPPVGTNLDFETYFPDGNAVLTFEFPQDNSLYSPSVINTRILTRSYLFNSIDDKRYSSVKMSGSTDKYVAMQISAKTVNPDTLRAIDLTGFSYNEDFIEKSPIAKVAAECSILVTTQSGRINIDSITVEASPHGKNLRNRQ